MNEPLVLYHPAPAGSGSFWNLALGTRETRQAFVTYKQATGYIIIIIIINPRHACAAGVRVTAVVSCVCVSVCL